MEVPQQESYLDWCKKRALAYAEAGDLSNEINSMVSDLGKDPANKDNMAYVTGMGQALKNDPDLTKEQVVEWINEFTG